jgi:hypothetical protein
VGEVRARVLRALLAAAVVVSLPTQTHAVRKKSRQVVYVIAFGNISELAENEIRKCCGALHKAIRIQATSPNVQLGNACPENVTDVDGKRIVACEILQLHDSSDGFWISNQLRPPEPLPHVVMMTDKDPIPYTAKEPDKRLTELMDNLKSLITCHEFYHDGRHHQSVGDDACDWCAGESLKAPAANVMRRGKP